MTWLQPADGTATATANPLQDTAPTTIITADPVDDSQDDSVSVGHQSGWTEHWNEENHRPFWTNNSTGESTWHRPDDMEPEPQDEEEDWADAETGPTQGSTANPLTADPLPAGWEEHWSHEENRPYWRSAAGESTWTKPSHQ
jgi:hypothetical protein